MLALHDANLEDPVLAEPLDRLIDQAQGWDAEQDFLVLGPSHVDDRSRYDGLSCAGRSLNHRSAEAGR